jgi:hypothetical protein
LWKEGVSERLQSKIAFMSFEQNTGMKVASATFQPTFCGEMRYLEAVGSIPTTGTQKRGKAASPPSS